MQPDSQLNLHVLLEQARSLQEQLRTAHTDLAEAEVVGSARNGLVRVTMTAGGEFRSVRIDPSLDPRDVHEIEVLVLAALRDAAQAARGLAADVAQQLSENATRLGLGSR